MTRTQSSRSHETVATRVQGPLAERVKVVPPTQGGTDTNSPPVTPGRVVPSRKTSGSAWLRYSVQQGGSGSAGSSTKG